jgi:hypothetical protein
MDLRHAALAALPIMPRSRRPAGHKSISQVLVFFLLHISIDFSAENSKNLLQTYTPYGILKT